MGRGLGYDEPLYAGRMPGRRIRWTRGSAVFAPQFPWLGYAVPRLTSHPSTQQVVFEALLTLHNLIRNGAIDNFLAYLSTGDVFRLKNIATHWEGVLFIKRSDPGVKMTLTVYAQDIMHHAPEDL